MRFASCILVIASLLVTAASVRSEYNWRLSPLEPALLEPPALPLPDQAYSDVSFQFRSNHSQYVYELQLPFSFPLYSRWYRWMGVSATGTLQFHDEGNEPYLGTWPMQSMPFALSPHNSTVPAYIAPLFAALYFLDDSSCELSYNASQLLVRFSAVYYYAGLGTLIPPNSFDCVLFSYGAIDVRYYNISALSNNPPLGEGQEYNVVVGLQDAGANGNFVAPFNFVPINDTLSSHLQQHRLTFTVGNPPSSSSSTTWLLSSSYLLPPSSSSGGCVQASVSSFNTAQIGSISAVVGAICLALLLLWGLGMTPEQCCGNTLILADICTRDRCSFLNKYDDLTKDMRRWLGNPDPDLDWADIATGLLGVVGAALTVVSAYKSSSSERETALILASIAFFLSFLVMIIYVSGLGKFGSIFLSIATGAFAIASVLIT